MIEVMMRSECGSQPDLLPRGLVEDGLCLGAIDDRRLGGRGIDDQVRVVVGELRYRNYAHGSPARTIAFRRTLGRRLHIDAGPLLQPEHALA